jgi:membrane protein DedA with SNARE-associated domain
MDWLTEQALLVGDSPLLQGILVAASTLVLEDAATVGSGLLVAAGSLDFKTALWGLMVGILAGDLGLYVIGRFLGARCLAWGWVSEEMLRGPAGWMKQNLLITVIVSRFVPGSRTATYLIAGMLKAPFWRFTLYSVGAVVPWVLAILYVTSLLGEAVLPLLGDMTWPVAALAILAFVLSQIVVARKQRRLWLRLSRTTPNPDPSEPVLLPLTAEAIPPLDRGLS